MSRVGVSLLTALALLSACAEDTRDLDTDAEIASTADAGIAADARGPADAMAADAAPRRPDASQPDARALEPADAGAERPECGVAVLPGCRFDLAQADCEATGGAYREHRPRSLCLCPTPDADCPCTTTNECAGECVARSASGSAVCAAAREGQCTPTYSALGCACVLGPDRGGVIPAGESRIRCAD